MDPKAAESRMGLAQVREVVLRRLTEGTVTISPYPAVALRLRRLVQQPGFRIEDVAGLVSADPVLAAAVLATAASAASAAREPPRTVRDAVVRIGARSLGTLALSVTLGKSALLPGPLRALKFLHWRRSVMTSLAAQELASDRGLDPETTATLGLLHGLAGTLTLSTVEELVSAGHAVEAASEAAWLGLIEECQSRAGVRVAQRWKLPAALVAELGARSDPQGVVLRELLDLVGLAVANIDRGPDLPAFLAPHARSPRELERLTALLPTLPGAVAALVEMADAHGAGGPSLLLPAALPADLQPTELTAVDLRAHTAGPFRVSALSAGALVMTGTRPLPENWLCHLGIGELELWFTVKRAWEDESGFCMLAEPFALGQNAHAWRALCARPPENTVARASA